jgi:hypothetical protein
MELMWHQVLYPYDVYLENKDSDNCAMMIEEKFNRMFGIKSMNDEHDCNVVSMLAINIHDANDMQSHKLGDAMFDEDDMFSSLSFDEQIYYNESMPPIFDYYCDSMYDIKNNDNHESCHHDFNFQFGYANQVPHGSYFVEFAPTNMNEKNYAYVESSKIFMLVHHEKGAVCDGYIVEFIHDATQFLMREELMLISISILSSFLFMRSKY